MNPRKTALAFSLLLAFGAPSSWAFVGQEAASAPTVGAPSAMRAPAPQAGGLNAPGPAPLASGAIAANQLAAGDSAIDKMLYAAIEAGSVEDVKAALAAGVNLTLDFSAGCPIGRSAENAEEESWQRVDVSKLQVGALPGRCIKQHLYHALAKAMANLDVQSYLSLLPQGQVERLVAFPQGPARDEALKHIAAAASARQNSAQILALLDANTPAADKAFYPAMVARLAFMTKVDPIPSMWALRRYEEALPEIKRARALGELARGSWDASMAKLDAARKGGSGQSQVALFNPAAIGGDGASTVKAAATALLKVSAAAGHPDNACALEGLAKEFSAPQQNGPIFARAKAIAEFKDKYLSDDATLYSAEGMKATPFAAMLAEADAIAALDVATHRNGAHLLMAEAIEDRARRSMVAYLLSQPDVVSALGNEQGQPAGSSPPLHEIAYAVRYSPALIRALLNAGVSPTARDSQGRTAADAVMDGTPRSLWTAKAFVVKDYRHSECVPH